MNSFRLLDGHVQFINTLAGVLDEIADYFAVHKVLSCVVYLGIGTNESPDDEHFKHQSLANVRFFDAHAPTLANALKLELVAKHYSVTIDPYLKDSYAIVTVVAENPQSALEENAHIALLKSR